GCVCRKTAIRDRYHRSESSHYAKTAKPPGLGRTGGLAFVSHADAVFAFSGRHPLGVETENSFQEIPSPTSESYLPNSAILLGATRTARGPWFWGKPRPVAEALIYLTKIKVLSAPVIKFFQVELGIKLKVIQPCSGHGTLN